MKNIIISFKEYLIRYNEGIIEPSYFDSFLEELNNKRLQINNLDSINNISKDYNLKFVNFDYFYNSLGEEIEKQLAPKDLLLMGGVKFALFNKYENIIMVVVDEPIFFDYLKSESIQNFLVFLREVLRHESIHLKQVDKMKDKSKYLLDSSPTHNANKYWREKRELMAYAQTFIDHLVQSGLDKEEIKIKLINQKDINSWIFNIYKKILDEKEMKRFMKYVYLYYEKL